MKAVKRTMMAVAVGMIMAAPAWAAHVEGESGPVTAQLVFAAPTTKVVMTVNAVNELVAGPLAEDAKLADVDVTHDKEATETLAVAWTLGLPKQLVNADGLTATISEKDNDEDKLKVKLVMTHGGPVVTVDNAQQWVPSTEKGEYKGAIEADAGNTDVKAGTYMVSLDGAVYEA